MKNYRVEAPITLHAGVIGLDKDQAAVRSRALGLRKRGGIYPITGRIQFKAGEQIRLDKSAAKIFGSALTDLDALDAAAGKNPK